MIDDDDKKPEFAQATQEVLRGPARQEPDDDMVGALRERHPELSREDATSVAKAVELLRPYALECLRRRVTDWATGATSRAEGKQAMRSIDPETKRVELDFAGIDFAAPSFGHEIWCVWVREHSNTRVVAVNVSAGLYPHLRRGGAVIEEETSC